MSKKAFGGVPGDDLARLYAAGRLVYPSIDIWEQVGCGDELDEEADAAAS